MTNFQGDTAVVWGDLRGVGTEIARGLRDAGAEVRRATPTDGLEIGDFVDHVVGDSGLDILVICVEEAQVEAPLAEMSEQDWEEEMAAGATLVFRGLRAALGPMLDRGAGRIVVVLGIESKVPRHGASGSVASQHAIAGLVKSVAHEVGRSGISINALTCGVIGAAENPGDEELVRRAALDRSLSPAEVAAAAVFLAEPTESLTGAMFPAHAGASYY